MALFFCEAREKRKKREMYYAGSDDVLLTSCGISRVLSPPPHPPVTGWFDSIGVFDLIGAVDLAGCFGPVGLSNHG